MEVTFHPTNSGNQLFPRETDAFVRNLWVKLSATAEKLKANANNENPKPILEVVSSLECVAVLKAISHAYEDTQLITTLWIGDEPLEIPLLERLCFTDVKGPKKEFKEGTFRARGIVRGDHDGEHELILEGRLVLLLKDGKMWEWGKIHNCLEKPTYFVGVIQKADDGYWTIRGEARLAGQRSLDEGDGVGSWPI